MYLVVTRMDTYFVYMDSPEREQYDKLNKEKDAEMQRENNAPT